MENTLKATATGANRLFIYSALSVNVFETKTLSQVKNQRALQPNKKKHGIVFSAELRQAKQPAARAAEATK